MDAKSAKESIAASVESLSEEMTRIAQLIHAKPELGFQEFYASGLHTEFLEKHGFKVERELLGMKTAYRATFSKGEGPKVALLAEFDALPKLGHACGHNLFGMASCGAAVALSRVMQKGTVCVFGTPAEEGTVPNASAKAPMAKAGLFDEFDAVMIGHAEGRNILRLELISRALIEMDFIGKPAHAAGSPELGRNALDAASLALMGINSLRQHFTKDVRVHGIMSDGGSAVNTIPDFAQLRFGMRAKEPQTLDDVVARVLNCCECCAKALDCEFKYRPIANTAYTVRHNMTLLGAVAKNLDLLGAEYVETEKSSYTTDVGNVSYRAPAIHPYFSIGRPGLPGHTEEFAVASNSPAGFKGMILCAKTLAMTAFDVLEDDALRAAVRAEFESNDTGWNSKN